MFHCVGKLPALPEVQKEICFCRGNSEENSEGRWQKKADETDSLDCSDFMKLDGKLLRISLTPHVSCHCALFIEPVLEKALS